MDFAPGTRAAARAEPDWWREEGLKIVAIVGSGSDCGKTTVACAILRGIPGVGAVKISPRDEPPRVEWGPGASGKDTSRYAESGAAKVARIVAPRGGATRLWGEVRSGFEGCAGILVEGSGAVDLPGEAFVIFLAGGAPPTDRLERNARLLASADLIVLNHPHGDRKSAKLPEKLSHLVCGKELLEIGSEEQGESGLLQIVNVVRRYLLP